MGYGIKVYDNDIQVYLDEFMSMMRIEDREKVRPQEWSACLLYIYNHTFRIDNRRLKTKDGRYNQYDLFAIDELLDIYITISNLYSQLITVFGFASLSGIKANTIYNWEHDNTKQYRYIDLDGNVLDELPDNIYSGGNNTDEIEGYRKVTISRKDIYQKLSQNIEVNINDMVVDGKRRGVGAIVRFNQFYDGKMGGRPRADHAEIDADNLVESLGITSEIALLSGE